MQYVIMNGKYLEAKARNTLIKDGYSCEAVHNEVKKIKGKFISIRHDFFNVVDIIALKGDKIRFIQVTSDNAPIRSTALYSHKEKINKLWKFDIPIELWFYKKENNKWKLSILIYYKGEWNDKQ